MKHYRKVIAAAVAAVVAIVGRLTGVDSDAYYIATAVAGVVAVFLFPNEPADA